MQIATDIGRERFEPAGAATGGEGALEARGVGGVVHDVAEELPWSCGFEDGEDGGGRKRCGEFLCYRAKCDKNGGVGGQGGYAGKGGEGE